MIGMHFRPQSRSLLVQDAAAQIERAVENAVRQVIAAHRGRRAFLYAIRPSQRQIEDAARHLAPSESRLAIATATHRRLPISVTPGDVPDVACVFNDGIVRWQHGRPSNVMTYRVEPGSAGMVAYAVQGHRPIYVEPQQIADKDGRPLTAKQVLEISMTSVQAKPD